MGAFRVSEGRSRLLLLLVLACASTPAAAQTPERLRWELVTNGSSNLGGSEGGSGESPVPSLTGTDANFMFQLDAQPLLNYGARSAKLSHHLVFRTGITTVGRTVTAKTDVATSAVVETLVSQGATVTPTTTSGVSLTRQRAFTAGFEYSANRLAQAQQNGAFMEFGVVAKGHFDAFLDDQRFFEKSGLTYVKVNAPAGSDAGYYRVEAGFRFRLSQKEEVAMPVAGVMKGGNVDDLLLLEVLYERQESVQGLLPDIDTANRLVMRFLATPDLPDAMTMKNMRMLLGLEVNNDWRGKGTKDVRIFYGVNADLKSLFK